MRLPGAITQFLQNRDKSQERFLSLILDVDSVQAGVWHTGPKAEPIVTGRAVQQISEDSWEERIAACDRVIAQLEDKEGTTALHKTILGFPAVYLTPRGDMHPSVRPSIRKLTEALELEAVGFVPIHQALLYQRRQEEGVPPSVIFIGITTKNMTVSLYKVGELVGQKVAEKNGDVAHLEEILRNFKDVEILPSRMLLYGAREELVDEVRVQLLRHPWQTKANFLHFPKIEALPAGALVDAVSLAGASEIIGTIKGIRQRGVQEPEEELQPSQGTGEREHGAVTATPPVSEPETGKENKEEPVSEGEHEEEEKGEESEAPEEREKEEPPVEMVAPETFGFQKGKDILEEKAQISTLKTQIKEEEAIAGEREEEGKGGKEEAEKHGKPLRIPVRFPAIRVPALPKITLKLPKLPSGKGTYLVVAGIGACVVAAAAVLWWMVPHVTVTVLEIPKVIEGKGVVTVDPQATVINGEKDVIPGKKQEKTVTGEKKIPVTGKKKVGDPARGTVTVYNKTTAPRTFPKGAVLVSGSSQFTLDDDVQIASASENLVSGTVTFGKTNTTITASAIGSQSNLPASSEFTFKDVSVPVAVARNEAALAGGTSRDVTVVSRADYDGLVTALSAELLEKAKGELAGSVGGGEKLIDATVKTAVTDKSFGQELDQEATELDGKVTVVVTGISYAEADLVTLCKGIFAGQIPQGYELEESRTAVAVANVAVKKDGKISANVTFNAVALPTVDTGTIAQAIAGKNIRDATDILKKIPGVAGAEFSFRLSPTESLLPVNKQNISVSLSIQE